MQLTAGRWRSQPGYRRRRPRSAQLLAAGYGSVSWCPPWCPPFNPRSKNALPHRWESQEGLPTLRPHLPNRIAHGVYSSLCEHPHPRGFRWPFNIFFHHTTAPPAPALPAPHVFCLPLALRFSILVRAETIWAACAPPGSARRVCSPVTRAGGAAPTPAAHLAAGSM